MIATVRSKIRLQAKLAIEDSRSFRIEILMRYLKILIMSHQMQKITNKACSSSRVTSIVPASIKYKSNRYTVKQLVVKGTDRKVLMESRTARLPRRTTL